MTEEDLTLEEALEKLRRRQKAAARPPAPVPPPPADQLKQKKPRTPRKSKTSAPTLQAAAEEIGISYRSLLNWKNRAGFPSPNRAGNYSIPDIKAFIEANRRNNHGGQLASTPPPEGDEERRQKIRKLRAEADSKELKVQEMRGLLINAREIAELHAREIEQFRSAVFRLLIELPPRLALLTDPATIEAELRTSFNSIFGSMAAEHDPLPDDDDRA